MFPDDVERYSVKTWCRHARDGGPEAAYEMIDDTEGDYVSASDYDKLLAMYQEAIKPPTVDEQSIALRSSLANLRGDEIVTSFMRRRTASNATNQT